MTTLAEIKAVIENLPEQERAELATWLASLERQAWDAQMAEDFSPGGRGMELLQEVDAAIDREDFTPLR
ncbi:MAG: hypothetical protein AAB225_26295 [Acidobacteriota bacterium]